MGVGRGGKGIADFCNGGWTEWKGHCGLLQWGLDGMERALRISAMGVGRDGKGIADFCNGGWTGRKGHCGLLQWGLGEVERALRTSAMLCRPMSLRSRRRRSLWSSHPLDSAAQAPSLPARLLLIVPPQGFLRLRLRNDMIATRLISGTHPTKQG